jgi:hypothetical protein
MKAHAAVIFLSAFLLFQIQPLAARYFLPWFGGTSAVWSTVVLFFQVLLTAGYAYAHWLSDRVPVARQGRVHATLVLISAACVLALGCLWPSPVTPDPSWKPADAGSPASRLLVLLAVSTGVPYFVLAANSPLQQAWVARRFPGRSPYALYALSNVGSLLALVTYPTLLEPLLPLRAQGWVWAAGYVVFAVCVSALAWRMPRFAVDAPPEAAPEAASADRPGPAWLWLSLSAAGSVLLLAVTSRLTQEIAPIPFLWVLPLALYLLSFILPFAGGRASHAALTLPFFALGSVALAAALLFDSMPLVVQIGLSCVFLFLACLALHAMLYRTRPGPEQLTRFYLLLSIGGALGGGLVNFAAPALLDGYWELLIGWTIAAALIAIAGARCPDPELPAHARRRLNLLGVTLTATAALVSHKVWRSVSAEDRWRGRNFYGVLRVRELPKLGVRSLVHGMTTHGVQLLDPARRGLPSAYYWEGSGIGRMMGALAAPRGTRRLGLLGMGIGVLASYGEAGDLYRYYEIDADCITLARGGGGWFDYVRASRATVETVEGDARLSLERELRESGSQLFHLLVVDVFSSDAIPVHLLTREAFALYLAHLAPNGVLALHISNRHLDLRPVVSRLAQEHGLHGLFITVPGDPSRPETMLSEWVLLARDPALLRAPGLDAAASPLPAPGPLWTDDYCPLWHLLR